MPKVKLALAELSVSEKIQLTDHIVGSMTDNAAYPTPNPSLADVQEQLTKVKDAAAKAEEIRKQSQIATIELENEEDALDAVLTQLGSYVENASGGEEARILSAGMDVRAESTAIGIPAAPGPIAATAGDAPGEVDLSWSRVRGAKSYVIQHAPAADAADADWKFATTTTRSSGTVTGLTPGTRYWFRVAATAPAGQSPWSSPAPARSL